MTYYQNPGSEAPVSEQSVVLIDYENLYTYFAEQTSLRPQPHEAISDLSDACKAYLHERWNSKSSTFAAFADFSLLPSQGREIQRRLYLNGVEPHYVPGGIQKNAAELQLCVEAVSTIQSRDSVDLLVILTADRVYLPLATYCQHKGIDVVIVTFQQQEFASGHSLSECYTSGQEILRTYARSGYSALRTSGEEAPPKLPAKRSEPVAHRPITNPIVLHVLNVIEEHFGQYNEIFLTPLLRKLSEIMGDQHDPKQLITELEEAGAVWLEKRSGYPYDFTVMIMDADHPDVSAVQSVEDEEGNEDYYEDGEQSTRTTNPIYDSSASMRDSVIRRLGGQG